MMKAEPKNQSITIRVSNFQHNRLNKVLRTFGLKQSEMIRIAIDSYLQEREYTSTLYKID
jgi:predicted DNA-binding protein